MNVEHIFESGHLLTTIVGWVIFLIGCAWFGVLLPYACDAWVINQKINPRTFDDRKAKKREEAIERLARYHDFVVEHSSYRNKSGVLNDFGKRTIVMTVACLFFIALGIWFPSVPKVFWWIVSHTM